MGADRRDPTSCAHPARPNSLGKGPHRGLVQKEKLLETGEIWGEYLDPEIRALRGGLQRPRQRLAKTEQRPRTGVVDVENRAVRAPNLKYSRCRRNAFDGSLGQRLPAMVGAGNRHFGTLTTWLLINFSTCSGVRSSIDVRTATESSPRCGAAV